ncbi:MAG: hypothetical protein IT458_12665 [Planctomycetes bacterium]|nr:hypothetical protein [Planctomycetota bacterium]
MRIPLLLCLSLVAAEAAAQQTITMPPGRETVEGASASTVYAPWYGSSGQGRYQWFSGLNKGLPMAIRKLEMRRDGVAATSSGYVARTTDMEIVMADTVASTFSTTYASNYKNGQSTVVFTRKPVSLPSHGPNVGSPAPWSIAVQYDVPFIYLAQDDLLVEISCLNTTPTGSYSLDCEVGSPAKTGTATYLDVAGKCQTPNGAFDIFYGSPAVGFAGGQVTIGAYAVRGPSNASGVLGIGLVDLNNNFGGLLCAKLRTDLAVTLPVTTDAVGGIGSSANRILATFPEPNSNFNLYGQFAVLDPSQPTPALPVALSDSVRWSINAVGVPLGTLWNDTSSAATTGILTSTSVPVIRFTY